MAVAVAGRQAGRGAWSTLRVLRSSRSVLLLSQCVVLLVSMLGLLREGRTLENLRREAVPAVVDAEALHTALAGMESAAKVVRLPGTGAEAQAGGAYERDHSEVLGDLLRAAALSGPGEERGRLEAIAEDLNRFDVALQSGRAGAGRTESIGGVDTELLQGATQLAEGRDAALERQMLAEQVNVAADRALLAVCVVALLAALIVGQVLLARRTRRSLNVALVAVTLLTVFEGVSTWQGLSRVHEALGARLLPAVRVLEDVSRARAAAALYEGDRMHAGERAEPGRAAQQHALEVVSLPPQLSPEQTMAALREGRTLEDLHGHLGDALKVAPRGVEREKVLDLLQRWLHFAGSGNRAAGDSFQAAAAGATAEEMSEIATLEKALTRELRVAGVVTLVACGAGGFLLLLGFAPRLREYER